MTARRVAMEDILCPTDFSEFSERALRHAAALALHFGARLRVLHVMTPMPVYESDTLHPAATPIVVEEKPSELANERLRAFVAPCQGSAIDLSLEVREGEPWREICKEAETLPADMLVIGTHGRGGFERFLLGSVAEKVLRRVACPVMSVCHEEGRTWEAPGLVSRIVCAIDLKESSTRTIEFALAMAAEKEARVTFLHVVEQMPTVISGGDYPFAVPNAKQLTEDAVAMAERQLHSALPREARKEKEMRERIETGRAHEKILEVAAAERADLIVIGSRDHGALERLVSESTLQHVVRAATCPVLTVRPSARPAPRAGVELVQVTRA